MSLQPLYVQCNPLLDISAKVDADFLKKYDVAPASAGLVTPEQMPIYGDLEGKPDCVYIPGGSGLNTARVANWMAQAPKLSFATYVGCAADDKYGKILKESAEKEGVQMLLEFSEKNPTGSCAVCICGKERSLVANLAAANDLSQKHIDSDAVTKAMSNAKLFYLTGFTLTLSIDYVLKVAQHSVKNEGTFMMNLSAPFILQFFWQNVEAVLPYLDVIFSNDDEAAVFAEKMKWDTKDTLEIAKKAAALPKEGKKERLVVFTCGSKATVWATKSGSGSVDVPAIAADKIIDTNGAGDSFVGGFLAGYAKGLGVDKCIEAGNYAAGVIIQHDGCTFPDVPAKTW